MAKEYPSLMKTMNLRIKKFNKSSQQKYKEKHIIVIVWKSLKKKKIFNLKIQY